MSDVLMIVVVCAFFGVATLYVRLCDRVIGPDPVESEPEGLALEGHEPVSGHVDPRLQLAEVDRVVRVGR